MVYIYINPLFHRVGLKQPPIQTTNHQDFPSFGSLQTHLRHEKSRGPLLSIESWLFNMDPYHGLS